MAFFSSTANRRAGPPSIRRMVPEGCKPFFRSDGTLTTTQTNLNFLREYDITHDNGEVSRTPPHGAGKAPYAQFAKFGVMVNFTPKHVISPYHVAFLDPRGHPLAPQHRERYANKALTQPIWFITTSTSSAKAVVRITAQRRIRAAVYMALQTKGYDKFGKGQHGDIKGTVWMHVVDPLRAVSNPDKEAFGRSVVEVMEAVQKRKTGRGKVDQKDVQFSEDRRRGNAPQSHAGRQTRDTNLRGSSQRHLGSETRNSDTRGSSQSQLGRKTQNSNFRGPDVAWRNPRPRKWL